MSQLRISRSPDLQRLRDEGYDISIRAGYLLVRIPYVNGKKEVSIGLMVTDLTLAGDVTAPPASHVMWFAGDHPCDKHGRELEPIRHAAGRQVLADGVVVDRSFSNKPATGYRDYYEKVSNYGAIIGHPAESLDPNSKIRTFHAIESEGDDSSVFYYLDSAATKAGIAATTDRFRGQRVAIVGLGGTGSYVLDLVAKCAVSEIHLFDGDWYAQHNAFRSPGAPSVEELQQRALKVEWFARTYSRMHRGIIQHPYYIDQNNSAELLAFDFVFLCVDRNDSRKQVLAKLVSSSVRFIDAGMGIELDDNGQLGGILRVTSSTSSKRDHLARRVPQSDPDGDGIYRSNIQVADLNCLNATMAVIKWKKLSGFYRDLEQEHNSTYTTDSNMLLCEDH